MGGSSAPTPYQPTGQSQADQQYQQTLGQLTSNNQKTFDYVAPAYQSAVGNITNNPYNASELAGAVSTGANATAAGQTDFASGQTVAASGQTDAANAAKLGSFAPGIAATGFDPQSANYNFGIQRAQDAQRVAGAQAGVAGSPYGAGAVGDAGAAFDRSWSSDQATRQSQALSVLASLFGGQGALLGDQASLLGQQSSLNSAGLGKEASGMSLPAGIYQDQQQRTISALQALVTGLGGASSTLANDVTQHGQYLGIGQNATQVGINSSNANNAGLNAFLGGISGAIGQVGAAAMAA